jgi:hypothetical protein
MCQFAGQQPDLSRTKLFCSNLHKGFIVVVHNLEHVDLFEPLLNLFEHLDAVMVLTVPLELQEPYGADHLWNLDIYVIDIESFQVLG